MGEGKWLFRDERRLARPWQLLTGKVGMWEFT